MALVGADKLIEISAMRVSSSILHTDVEMIMRKVNIYKANNDNKIPH